MLINCLNCGKKISSHREACVYCKTDVSEFIAEFKKSRGMLIGKTADTLKEKYAGTLLGFLLKTKVH